MKYDYIKQPIIDFLNNNPGKRLNSVDICNYFKVTETVLAALEALEVEGRITRINQGVMDGWGGNHHYEVNE